jgi:hypothetical protein
MAWASERDKSKKLPLAFFTGGFLTVFAMKQP